MQTENWPGFKNEAYYVHTSKVFLNGIQIYHRPLKSYLHTILKTAKYAIGMNIAYLFHIRCKKLKLQKKQNPKKWGRSYSRCILETDI